MAAANTRQHHERPSFRGVIAPPKPAATELVQLNARIHKDTKRRLKVAALERGMKEQELVEQLLLQGLDAD